MMTHGLYFVICFSLVILQTTIMPYFSLFDRFYDLLSPFILYLSLFRSISETIPVILFFGFVMDSLSGGPFGLYLTTYLWLFIGVRWIMTLVDVSDSLLLPFVVAAGVLLQNLIFVGTIAMLRPGSWFSSIVIKTIAEQILWAIITGPIFLILINYSHKRFDNWQSEMFSKKTGNRY